MSYTNTTSHYSLPQYVGSDKPKYLTDFNTAMATIDGQMYDNATAASTADSKADAAQSTADANTSSITALDTQINGDSGLAADVAANQGAITTINSLIGNGTPTTTDKTLIGAINELDADIQAEDAKVGDLTDLTTTEKTSVVAAINEVNSKVDYNEIIVASVTGDGVKTISELLDELYAAATWITNQAKMAATKLIVDNSICSPVYFGSNLTYTRGNITSNATYLASFDLKASGSTYLDSLNGTISDNSSTVVNNGVVLKIIR